MTIRVLDQANLPADSIDKMERHVEDTLASIEVDVKWVECPKNLAVCRSLREPNEFWLRILALKPPDVNPGADLLGFTQHGDTADDKIQCVNIFYPVVGQLSERTHLESYRILGAAVAHEIGHLYLGSNSQAHSRATHRGANPFSLFASELEFELLSIGELKFTREQAERIRAAMCGHREARSWFRQG